VLYSSEELGFGGGGRIGAVGAMGDGQVQDVVTSEQVTSQKAEGTEVKEAKEEKAPGPQDALLPDLAVVSQGPASTKRVEAPAQAVDAAPENSEKVNEEKTEAPTECPLDDSDKPQDPAKSTRPARKTTRKSNRESARAKRRRVKPEDSLTPNPSLFVGYVEDGETIEMIMKKFEKLEEITKKKEEETSEEMDKTNPSGGLDEETLAQVFKETSAFTVKSASRELYNDGMEDFAEYYEDDGWDWGDVMTAQNDEGDTMFLIGDGTDDDLWEEVFGSKKSKQRRSQGRKARGDRSRNADSAGVTQIAFVSDMHLRFITGLKKIRKVDPNAIVYQKIPNEIPSSWAKPIRPYVPNDAVNVHTAWRPDAITLAEETFSHSKETPENAEHYTVSSMLKDNWFEQVQERAPFEGIVLSPPWRNARMPLQDDVESKSTNNDLEHGIEPEDLAQLNLERPGMVRSGFLYIWTPKHLILRVLRALEKMNFHYVENAVYVKQHVRNELWCEPSRYFRQSKETLLICRRGKKHPVSGKISWERVEIRHQRTSDVHFEFTSMNKESNRPGVHAMPHSYVHNMVETMLPHGRFNPAPSLEPVPEATQAGEKTKGKEESNTASESAPKKPLVPACEPTRGKLLHLWAPKNSLRTGWVTVSQS